MSQIFSESLKMCRMRAALKTSMVRVSDVPTRIVPFVCPSILKFCIFVEEILCAIFCSFLETTSAKNCSFMSCKNAKSHNQCIQSFGRVRAMSSSKRHPRTPNHPVAKVGTE